MINNYIESCKKQFLYYKTLGERSFGQLEAKDLFWQYNTESNSIAIIVHHLSGNMRSRWTDFLISDGEKDWRNRDQEFEDVIKSKADLLEYWEKGWACLFAALDTIDESNFHQLVYIRNQGHTIVEAINRQLAHYAYHIGQMVYIARMIKGPAWESLSIPKGDSGSFNREKFAQKKDRKHFTDEFLGNVSLRTINSPTSQHVLEFTFSNHYLTIDQNVGHPSR